MMEAVNLQAYEKFLDYLCCHTLDLSLPIDREFIQDIFIHPRKEVLKIFRQCLKKKLADEEALKGHFHYASGLIALIPYTYPEEGEIFKIPIFDKKNTIRLVAANVTQVMNATIDGHLTPLKAYALEGGDLENFLIFTGTTFPAGQGFLNALIADFTPFLSVGKIPYKLFQKQLQSFFSNKVDVHVFGMSLGGALSLHTLREFHPKISHVYAHVPAGLHFYEVFDKDIQTKVTIISHANDVVSKLGFFPEHKECQFFEINVNKLTGLNVHAQLLANHPLATMRKIDPTIENRGLFRRIISIVHLCFSWTIFIPLCFFYLIYKIAQVVKKVLSFMQTFLDNRLDTCILYRQFDVTRSLSN